MNRISIYRIISLVVLSLGIILPGTSCKKADSGSTVQYALTVSVSDGATGTPAAGSYTYEMNEQVTYTYSLLEGYDNLKVLLDQAEVADSGTITMSTGHQLNVRAYRGSGDLEFIVQLSEGVSGTPGAGYYQYSAGDVVDYDFQLEDGYQDLQVFLNGIEIDPSGSITMSENVVLTTAAKIIRVIEGAWTIYETYSDGSAFSVTLTFSGGLDSGTVIDSDGGSGTYEVDGNNATFTIQYPDVTYEYLGVFSTADTMGGSSRRYISATEYKSGSWTANRN